MLYRKQLEETKYKEPFAKLVFMGTSPIHTTQGTQPSKEQTNPRPLCDEMGTLNNILSHDSRENVK